MLQTDLWRGPPEVQVSTTGANARDPPSTIAYLKPKSMASRSYGRMTMQQGSSRSSGNYIHHMIEQRILELIPKVRSELALIVRSEEIPSLKSVDQILNLVMKMSSP
ncbi:hypothetical protein J1614_011138 [Plenodomus biglobosus]|nr:hypothetical protein J1614_011138 [Plenodomus biglobosus]